MQHVVIQFNTRDVREKFTNRTGCPIFRAMSRAGVPVSNVSAVDWTDFKTGEHHFFSAPLQQISTFLAGSTIRQRSKLVGKKVTVTW